MASLNFDEQSNAFKEYYASKSTVFSDAADSLRTLISLLLADNDSFPAPEVLSRVKDRDGCIAKFDRKYRARCEEDKSPYEIKEYITDLVGLRVICLYEEDIPIVKKILTDNFEVLEESNKSQAVESQEAAFGYKGLHMDLKLPENRRDLYEYRRFRDLQFEVQLRTRVQDAWSVLDHKIKYKRQIPLELKRRVNRLAALFELADQEFQLIRNETRRLESEAKSKTVANPLPEITGPVAEVHTPAPVPALDAFSFLGLAERFYPTYRFEAHKIEGFVSELLDVAPSLTAEELEAAIVAARDTVEAFKSYQQEHFLNRLNPYTTIRHALYLRDRARYAPLLFDVQRRNFEGWLNTR